MKYDEKEELEQTNEWLLRVNAAGFSEELFYVPSELDKLGVAPKDVVDRRDWLRRHAKKERPKPEPKPVAAVGRARVQMAPVMVLDRPEEEVQEEPEIAAEETTKVPVLELVDEPEILPYNEYGPWEWFNPSTEDTKFEEWCKRTIIAPEPGLPEFNKFVAMTNRRKRIRASRASRETPIKELVGTHS